MLSRRSYGFLYGIMLPRLEREGEVTKQDINHYYEQSVYEIRLRVAIGLLAVPGIDHDKALEEADRFVERLCSEDANWLINRF